MLCPGRGAARGRRPPDGRPGLVSPPLRPAVTSSRSGPRSVTLPQASAAETPSRGSRSASDLFPPSQPPDSRARLGRLPGGSRLLSRPPALSGPPRGPPSGDRTAERTEPFPSALNPILSTIAPSTLMHCVIDDCTRRVETLGTTHALTRTPAYARQPGAPPFPPVHP